MAEVRQDELDGDPRGDGQIVETGKLIERIVQYLFTYKKYFMYYCLYEFLWKVILYYIDG